MVEKNRNDCLGTRWFLKLEAGLLVTLTGSNSKVAGGDALSATKVQRYMAEASCSCTIQNLQK